MLTRSGLLLFPLACLLPIAQALASDVASEEAFFTDIPLTLTATRLPQPAADSPVSTTIIDSEMIRAYGAVELIDVLRLVPGFQVVHPSGERVAATYHGRGDEFSRRLQVLIDGRSVYSPILGQVNWVNLPINAENIERIEVTRGPNAASYGANSFAGVVNIITKHSSQTAGTSTTIETGHRDHQRYFLQHSGQEGNFSYRLSTSFRSDNGFDTQEFPDDKQVRMLQFRGDYQYDPYNEFEFQFGLSEIRNEEGWNDPEDILVDPLRTSQSQHSFQLLRWQHYFEPDESLRVQFYHTKEIVNDTFSTASIDDLFGNNPLANAVLSGVGIDVNRGVLLPFDQYVHRYDLEAQHTFSPSRSWRIVWGGNIRRDEVGGRQYFNTDSNHDVISNDLYRVFGHAEWKPSPQWTFNLGATAEKNDITTGIRLSPRISANYHFLPGHTLRLSANRAYRTPTIFEEEVDILTKTAEAIEAQQVTFSAGGLKPENITTYELAWLANLPKYQTDFELKLFREEIRDIIVEAKDHAYFDHPLNTLTGFDVFDDVLFYTNDGYLNATGLELQLSMRPTRHTRVHLGHTYIKQHGESLGDINRASYPDGIKYDDLTQTTPRATTTLQVIHDFAHDLQGSLAFHRYGLYEFEGGDDTGDFKILNFRVAKKFAYGNSDIELAANFQNMLDEYFDFEKEQVFESGVYFSLKVNFD
jgi:iron complex outermembrane receptor protein